MVQEEKVIGEAIILTVRSECGGWSWLPAVFWLRLKMFGPALIAVVVKQRLISNNSERRGKENT